MPETRRVPPSMAAEIRPMRLIPAIDLKGGRCVRLLRGDFAAETRYEAEPCALLAKYRGYGADWIHVVDLDGARDGSAGNRSGRPRRAISFHLQDGDNTYRPFVLSTGEVLTYNHDVLVRRLPDTRPDYGDPEFCPVLWRSPGLQERAAGDG